MLDEINGYLLRTGRAIKYDKLAERAPKAEGTKIQANENQFLTRLRYVSTDLRVQSSQESLSFRYG